MEKHQYKNIYFLRFIFILMIVFCHIFKCVPELTASINSGGALGVEFFFILGGFFFAYTLDLNQTAFEYIKKRVTRLYSVIAFYALGCFLFDILNIEIAPGGTYGRIFQLLLLDGTGLNKGLYYGVSWFVSALVFSSLFLFYLYKSCPKKIANLLLAVIVLFSYIVLLNNVDIVVSHNIVLYNFLPLALLRAVAGMGLGIFLFYAYSYFNKNTAPQKFWVTFLYSFLEIFLFGTCIYTMVDYNYYNPAITIILICLLLYTFLINKGVFSRLLENNFSVMLGRYSYSIYLTHMFVLTVGSICYAVFDNGRFIFNYPLLSLLILYASSIILGVGTYHLIEKPNNALYKKLGLYYYFAVFGGILVLFTTAYISYSLAR